MPGQRPPGGGGQRQPAAIVAQRRDKPRRRRVQMRKVVERQRQMPGPFMRDGRVADRHRAALTVLQAYSSDFVGFSEAQLDTFFCAQRANSSNREAKRTQKAVDQHCQSLDLGHSLYTFLL